MTPQELNEKLDKAQKYLRELIPHDAPSSARKLEILAILIKTKKFLKSSHAAELVTVEMLANNLEEFEADEDGWQYKIGEWLAHTYPHGLIIKPEPPRLLDGEGE